MPDAGLVATLRAAGCVFAEEEAALIEAESGDAGARATMVARRVAGEPLEQVLGWAEFAGQRVRVLPGVFVPRRRTAALVDLAAGWVRPGSVLVDLCCGTGALGVALAARCPGIELHAADVDPDAVACARLNVVDGQVHEGDLYDALPGELAGRVDVLLVNAPYVPTARIPLMPPEARDHEHRVALDGGADGLDVHRRVAAGAPAWLAPSGVLLVETSRDQSPGTAAACAAAGLLPEVHRRAESTVVAARRPGPISAAGPRSGTMAR